MSPIKWIKHPLVWTLFMSMAAFFLSFGGCDKTDIPEPDPTIDSLMCVEDGGQVVGPCGGTVSYTDSTFDISNLVIDFQPGGTDYYQCFHPCMDASPFTLYLPPGFHGFIRFRCFDLGGGYSEEDSSLMMHMSIPVEGIQFDPDSSEILCAFYYDAARDTWPIVPPVNIDESSGTMTIVTPYRQYWNWGVLNLQEADYEETLKPFMERLHGHDEWAAIEAEIQAMYEQIIHEDWDASCAAIIAVRDQFYSQMMNARTTLLGIQAEIGEVCGPCNVYSGTFLWDLIDYFILRMREWFWTQMVLDNGINFVGCLCMIRLCMVYEDLARMCDYSCLMPLLRDNYPDFWSIYFRYLFNVLGYQLIEFGLDSGYLDC